MVLATELTNSLCDSVGTISLIKDEYSCDYTVIKAFYIISIVNFLLFTIGMVSSTQSSNCSSSHELKFEKITCNKLILFSFNISLSAVVSWTWNLLIKEASLIDFSNYDMIFRFSLPM